jgi:hypothetical protein
MEEGLASDGAHGKALEEVLLREVNWAHHDKEPLKTEPFGWNYKPAEKHCWLIFYERKILFRLKKQAE